MRLVSAFLAAALVAVKPIERYPTTEILAAFESACSELTGVNGARRVENWDSLTIDQEKSELGRLLGYMKRAALRRPSSNLIDSAIYTRFVGGRRVYLLSSQIESPQGAGKQCQMFDFNENLGLSREAIVQWVGRAPTSSMVAVNGIWADWWTPGLKPDHSIFQVEYGISEVRNIQLTASTIPLEKPDLDQN